MEMWIELIASKCVKETRKKKIERNSSIDKHRETHMRSDRNEKKTRDEMMIKKRQQNQQEKIARTRYDTLTHTHTERVYNVDVKWWEKKERKKK